MTSFSRVWMAGSLVVGLALPAIGQEADQLQQGQQGQQERRQQQQGRGQQEHDQQPQGLEEQEHDQQPQGPGQQEQGKRQQQVAEQDAEGDQGQEQAERRRARDVRFIFVEGSLPYIPTSNTIATKLALALRATPFHVGIVTSPLFKEQHAQVLNDALTNISGINPQPGFGAVHDFFVVRGFDSLSSGLVLTDGASEPEVSFYELYNVEAVEVLKGPGGFLYGSNPLAGAVNLVRKQPSPSTSTGVDGVLGRFDTYQGALDFNWAHPDGEYSFRLNSLVRDAGAYRDRIESQTLAANPAFAWNLSERASLNLNFEYLQADYRPDMGVPLAALDVPAIPRTSNYQSAHDDSQQDIYRFQADYQNVVNDGVTLRDKLYYRDLDWASAGTLYNGVFPVPQFDDGGAFVGFRDEVFRSLLILDDRQRFVGNQLEAILGFTTGRVHHDLLAGLEIARYGDEFTFDVAGLPNVSLADPQDPGPVPLEPLPGSLAGDSRSRIIAPYLIDQIRVSEQVQLLVGGRVDNIDFIDDLNAIGRDDTKASPMLGVVASPHPAVSLFGNFSRSFAPPVARVQNGERVPEEGTQYEAGVKTDFLDGRARATFAVYQIERENIAIPDDNGFTQQVGNQRSRGFEIELAAEPSPRLRAVTSYAYTDAELTNFTEQIIDPTTFPPTVFVLDRSGNRPAFAPEHVLDFWVSSTLPSGLGIGGGGRWISEQFIAEDNAFSIDDVFTLDAAVFYSYGDLRLSLNLENLTDREFVTRGFGGASVIPADPITVFFSVGYRL